MQISVLVLAGGASTRMGQNKSLLPVAGVPIIERVIGVARQLGDEVLLVGNDAGSFAHLQLPVVPDLQPHVGPLMGLYSGLRAASGDLALLLACDMPFLNVTLLSYLLNQAPGYDVVIPQTPDGLHPLHAVYRRATCLPAIEAAVSAGQRRMIAFHDRVAVRKVVEREMRPFDPAGVALMNVNTPDELAVAEHIARRAFYDAEGD